MGEDNSIEGKLIKSSGGLIGVVLREQLSEENREDQPLIPNNHNSKRDKHKRGKSNNDGRTGSKVSRTISNLRRSKRTGSSHPFDRMAVSASWLVSHQTASACDYHVCNCHLRMVNSSGDRRDSPFPRLLLVLDGEGMEFLLQGHFAILGDDNGGVHRGGFGNDQQGGHDKRNEQLRLCRLL
ncbi:hypothetical protein AKJ16_DCAP24914 [Drosera capensis]